MPYAEVDAGQFQETTSPVFPHIVTRNGTHINAVLK